jgi:hypothetical protein
MSRDGKLAINFNQPLIVPPFVTASDADASYENPADTSNEQFNNETNSENSQSVETSKTNVN